MSHSQPHSQPQYFRSQRGRPKLGYEGYIYQCQRESEHEIRWRCQCREKNERCQAKARSVGSVITVLSAHNHPPDYAYVEKEILKRNIIDNAANQGISTTHDLSGIIQSLPKSLASKMPTLDCMKRAIRRRQNVNAQSNRSDVEALTLLTPSSGGGGNQQQQQQQQYYQNITETSAGNSDQFASNSQSTLMFDAKELQTSLYDSNPTSSFPIIFESPMDSSPQEEPAMSTNNDTLEIFTFLQSQINDLKTENEELKAKLKTSDERLNEIEKILKINRKEIPADAKFDISRLTLSKIGTFNFMVGQKTVDVASFLRQVAPEEQSFDQKLPRKLFTECINMILGDSVIYYCYQKNPKDGCFQLDPNLFNCILGLICDGYGLSKDPQKDTEKDKYLRECVMEELHTTAQKVFKNAADPLKSKPIFSNPVKVTVTNVIEPPLQQSRPQSNTNVSVKTESIPEPPVYCVSSGEESNF